jgi:hypothetical protein
MIPGRHVSYITGGMAGMDPARRSRRRAQLIAILVVPPCVAGGEPAAVGCGRAFTSAAWASCDRIAGRCRRGAQSGWRRAGPTVIGWQSVDDALGNRAELPGLGLCQPVEDVLAYGGDVGGGDFL